MAVDSVEPSSAVTVPPLGVLTDDQASRTPILVLGLELAGKRTLRKRLGASVHTDWRYGSQALSEHILQRVHPARARGGPFFPYSVNKQH